MRWLLAALVAAVIGAVAGCGSTGLLTSPTPRTVTARDSAARATTSSTATSAGASVTTATTTGVTTVVTTTVNGTTTTLNEPGLGHPTILLGDMNTPEQFIIGELYRNALEAQGYSVELTRNIGTTSVSESALTQGSLDIFPEYLDIYDTQVAGDTQRFRTLSSAYDAAERWARAHGQELLKPTPFSDTAGIAVLSTYARAHHLRTLADLRRVQDALTLGSPIEYSQDPHGLAALESAYGFVPALTSVINIGGQYGQLRIGTLGAAYVQTTDWQLSGPLYRTLTDSRHVLGFGNIVPVVSQRVLEIEGPAFARAINRVDALLSSNTIRGLAAEMKDSSDPAMSASDVAQEFLQGYGILPPPPWSTLTDTTTTETASVPGPAANPATTAATTTTTPGG